MKMASVEQRREELEKKDVQLKESLVKFDKFLKVSTLITAGNSRSELIN